MKTITDKERRAVIKNLLSQIAEELKDAAIDEITFETKRPGLVVYDLGYVDDGERILNLRVKYRGKK